MDSPVAPRKPRFGPVAVCIAFFAWYHRNRIGRAIDRRVCQLHAAWLDARLRSKLAACGDRSTLEQPLVLNGPDKITIGQDSTLNAFVHIWGNGGVTIGDRVLVASHTAITSVTHDYTADQVFGTVALKPVVIEDDAWIGSGAVIMPGVTLGRGCVVGAAAVVTRDVPPYAIVTGIPARVTKYRPGHEPA
jgi:maltose O-acetyltransferase